MGETLRRGGVEGHRAEWARVLTALALALVQGAGALAGQTPTAGESRAVSASPGEPDRVARIATRTPTFSWGAVAGTTGYELLIWELPDDSANEGGELLRLALPGSVTSWTPDLERALPLEVDLGWWVRPLATPETEAADWSAPRLFRIRGAEIGGHEGHGEDAVPKPLGRRGWAVRRGQHRPAGAAQGRSRSDADSVASAGTAAALGGAISAIRGELPDPGGETYGVAGVSASPDGAGLAAANQGGGADLVLDGGAQAEVSARLDQASLDRPSPTTTVFNVRNSGAGAMQLQVDGVDVVTTATDRDSLADLACTVGEIARSGGADWHWHCASDGPDAGNQLQQRSGYLHVLEGAGSGLDADTVDGVEVEDLASARHGHFGDMWTGTEPDGLTLEASTAPGSALVVRHTSPTGLGNGISAETSASLGNAISGVATGLGAGVLGRNDGGFGVRGYGDVGVAGTSDSSGGRGVRGIASIVDGSYGVLGSGSHGVHGESASSRGRGVSGLASSPSGVTYGVYGRSESAEGGGVGGFATLGVGVRGHSDAPLGNGILGTGYRGIRGQGESIGVVGDGAYAGVVGTSVTGAGVRGHAAGEEAIGVRGVALDEAGFGIGVEGVTAAASGYGVSGLASSPSIGFAIGVRGESAGIGGAGVAGLATNEGVTQNYGVFGDASGTSGVGVLGTAYAASGPTRGVVGSTTSPDGSGVVGRSYGGGTGVEGRGTIGVYGIGQDSSSFAGFFDGHVSITGTLTESGGSFKIDHPLEPGSKYLSHSFVESPDMMNVYNGNVRLGAEGTGWVELPEWFEALNRDFRYQLTPLGEFAPLYVAERIAGNRFRIAGGRAGLEVSWQVTGIRQDAWAEANRVPVEELKPAEDQGRYLHPNLFGADADQRIGPRRSPERALEEAIAALASSQRSGASPGDRP